MRVFVAGATGAVGRPLVARLLAAGEEVTGTTRSERRAEALREAGAEAVVLDAFDRQALRAAVVAARPEVVVHQLTALSAPLNIRRYGDWLADTNRLRRDVTPVLVDAARAAGAQRVVAQSISFLVAPEGPPVVDEGARPWTDAPQPMGEAIRASVALEQAVTRAADLEGLVLRYGFFYGPGTQYGPGGQVFEDLRRRRYPVVGSGDGVFSLVHVEDAADATVLAVKGDATGVLNVVDDDPAPMRVLLPELARLIGAPPPWRVPAWLARLVVGPHAVHYAESQRGASNARARARLGWRPARASWREGVAELVGRPAEAAT